MLRNVSFSYEETVEQQEQPTKILLVCIEDLLQKMSDRLKGSGVGIRGSISITSNIALSPSVCGGRCVSILPQEETMWAKTKGSLSLLITGVDLTGVTVVEVGFRPSYFARVASA